MGVGNTGTSGKYSQDHGTSEDGGTRTHQGHLSILSETFDRLENLLGGVENYHTDASWLWIGAWHVIALVKTGQMDAAQTLVSRILNVIVQDRQVNEVHAPTGKPLSSMWYTSEAPLTWNAGMILYACHIFENKRQEEHKLLSGLFHKTTE